MTPARIVRTLAQAAIVGVISRHADSINPVVEQPGSHIARLCATIHCGDRPQLSFSQPKMTGFSGVNTPDGILMITGTGFGSKPGSVNATLRTWSGAPVQCALEVFWWTNTLVGVRWPSDIRGVRQHSVALALMAAEGGRRDWQKLRFIPALELKALPHADVQVLACGNDSNLDYCNGVGDPDDTLDNAVPAPTGSFSGSHNNVWAAVGDDKGTDVYQIALKNGWVMESFSWNVKVDDPDEESVDKPTGFTRGATMWSPAVKWNVTPSDEVSYAGLVMISGPMGVPHK